jgi:hypothetical protein
VLGLVKSCGSQVIIGELFFTDAAGVVWVKTSGGRLFECASPEWVSLTALSLLARASRLREYGAPSRGIRQRLLFWAISNLS